jgi:hypothetical protein
MVCHSHPEKIGFCISAGKQKTELVRDNLLACHTPLKIRDGEKESKPSFLSFAGKSFHQSQVYFLSGEKRARSPNNMADFIATFTHRQCAC